LKWSGTISGAGGWNIAEEVGRRGKGVESGNTDDEGMLSRLDGTEGGRDVSEFNAAGGVGRFITFCGTVDGARDDRSEVGSKERTDCLGVITYGISDVGI
jgi:hypothetical protein